MSQSLTLPTYSVIYAFGDSLSDAGNLSITTAITGTTPVSPPYYQEQYGLVSGNVFSNGPTWVQDLSVALSLGTLEPSLIGGTDFAYGGAESGPTPQNASDPEIQAISLPSQFTQFQTAVSDPAANALYTVSIGANDLLDILGETSLTSQQQATDVSDAVANEISFVKQLVGDGAKNLLVLDVPDLGKTPSVLQGLADGSGSPSPALDAEASQLASLYNADLTSQLTGLTGVNAEVINAYQLIDAAVATPAAYGLTNIASPVWSGNYTSSSSGTLATTGTTAQDQYLFWDHLHPTETGHQAIATLAEQGLSGDTTEQITQFYNNILQRAPDAAGLAYWETAATNGTLTLQQVDYGIATSSETDSDVVPIVQLYTSLGRAPDQAGLAGWVHDLEGGASLTSIAGDFLSSPEGQGIYGTAVGLSAAADATFVNTLYQEVLGRASDPIGAQDWTNALNAGVLTPAQELVGFIQSPEAQARDATPVTNFLLAAGNGTANYGGNLFDVRDPATSLVVNQHDLA
jgi:phospholipase/lecithinase/hemolysin